MDAEVGAHVWPARVGVFVGVFVFGALLGAFVGAFVGIFVGVSQTLHVFGHIRVMDSPYTACRQLYAACAHDMGRPEPKYFPLLLASVHET